jgi:CRISPR/Cas system-associated protein endoribonuclease Cas2
MRELYNLLVVHPEMDNNERQAISHELLNAIAAGDYPIEDNGLYLRVTDTDDADKMDIGLWYHHKDEDGNISVKNVTNDKGEILEVLHSKYIEKHNIDSKKL